MSISSLDIHILVGTSIFIIMLSFVAPAVGMTGSSVSVSEIPEFNVTSNYFAYIEQPQEPFPGTPNQGFLNASSDKFDQYPGHIQFYLGKNINDNRTFLSAVPNDQVNLLDVEKVTGSNIDNHTFTADGEIATLTGVGFVIDVKAINISDGAYEFIVEENPSDSKWWSGIPGVSATIEGINRIAGLIGYAIQMGAYVILTTLTAAANTLAIVVQVAFFIFSLLNWILTTYLAVIAGAPSGFASVFVAIPGILFSIEFGRLVFNFISVIPGVG